MENRRHMENLTPHATPATIQPTAAQAPSGRGCAVYIYAGTNQRVTTARSEKRVGIEQLT
jgi:hypothetical protein